MALKVTQVRSQIGRKPEHRGTLRALGLGRISQSNVLPDRPEIRGMLARVPFLVTVEEVPDSELGPQKYPRGRARSASPTDPTTEG